MSAQPPYMLLHQTSASPGANTTTATASNSNANFYQPRTGQNSGFGQRVESAVPYIAYSTPSATSNGQGNGGYYRTANVYQGQTNVNGPTVATASTSAVTIAGPSGSTSGRSTLTVASTSQKIPAFRAPAHKHAHHLHSIPPREKSTRTLIIDHMLWVHGRTRFAQARAELGMTDRTGGPSSSNYAHRTRPENYEEEDEIGSEGEEASVLKARGAIGGSNDRSEEARLNKQDLPLARTLRLRAEGLEKVVTSMLDQPPPVPHQPANDDYSHHHHYHHHHHHSHSHWQKYEASPNTRTGRHPHTLPNGVRLRLALGTIINDLFARQAPHPPYRHTHPPTTDEHSSETPPPQDPPPPAPSINPSSNNLPETLLPLVRISGVFSSVPSQHNQHQRSTSTQSPLLTYTPTSSPYQGFSSPPPSAAPTHQTYQQQQAFHHIGPSPFIVPGSQIYTVQPQSQTQPPLSTPRPRGPVTRPTRPQRALSLFASGADPLAPSSSHTARCPRHLQTGCEICVEAKWPSGRSVSGSGASGSSGSRPGFAVPSSSSSNNSGFGNIGRGGQHGAGGPASGLTGWQDGSGMGTGLLRPGPRGSVLRRKVYLGAEEHLLSTGSTPSSSGVSDIDDRITGAGNTKLTRIIPRFLKLSALVAGELGREVRGEEVDESSSSGGESEEEGGGAFGGDNQANQAQTADRDRTGSSSQGGHQLQAESASSSSVQPPGSPSTSRLRQHQQQHQKMYEYALKPTREWYMLLASLLTRAVLEGYLTAGWRGIEAAECLLLLGLGLQAKDLDENKENENEEEEDDESDDEDDVEGQDKEASKKARKAKKWRKRRKQLELFDEDEEYSEFHPDEYPSLFEAIRVLFPSLRNANASSSSGSRRKGKSRAEAEYEGEMYERLRRFYDIPASTPDLATHMEDLVWQYPAEPVERAAIRFCEAVAKWRGKPELETYKKKPAPKAPLSGGDASSTDPLQQLFAPDALSIESLVHSNPTSPIMGFASSSAGITSLTGAAGQYNTKRLKKPSVDTYFSIRDNNSDSTTWSGGSNRSPGVKRRRLDSDVGEGRDGVIKRLQA